MEDSEEKDCSSCGDQSCSGCSDNEAVHVHRVRCPVHVDAIIGRVRAKNKKLLEISSRITEKEVEEERERRRLQDTPQQRRISLEEHFPGGAAAADTFLRNYIPHPNTIATSVALKKTFTYLKEKPPEDLLKKLKKEDLLKKLKKAERALNED